MPVKLSQKYKKPELTGREYVDSTTAFCGATMHYCLRLPQQWENTVTKPLIDTAQEIAKIVVAANRIYISEGNMEKDELVAGYQERIQELGKALRLFSVFDAAFDSMMSFIDISCTEKQRLKDVLLKIIQEEQKNNPQVKDITIQVVSRGNDMTYKSAFGNASFRLKLTAKNRSAWLKAEKQAESYIKSRVAADRKAVSRLVKDTEA